MYQYNSVQYFTQLTHSDNSSVQQTRYKINAVLYDCCVKEMDMKLKICSHIYLTVALDI